MVKILYLEDDRANLRFIEKAIQLRNDLQCISAVSAINGLELARLERPDLILLDIQLPEIDGYTVFSRLRDQPETRSIPVVAISANAMQEDIKRAMSMGFSGYITKPVDLEELFETIDRLTGPD